MYRMSDMVRNGILPTRESFNESAPSLVSCLTKSALRRPTWYEIICQVRNTKARPALLYAGR